MKPASANPRVHLLGAGSLVGLVALGSAVLAQQEARSEGLSPRPVSTRLLDLDGDGALDLLAQHGGGRLEIEMQVEPRRFVATEQDLPRAFVSDVLVSDLDGDGRLDLYLVTPDRDLALVGQGGGRFVEATERLGLVESGFGLSAERLDLDGDGLEELVVHNQGSDLLYWAESGGGFQREARTVEGVGMLPALTLAPLANGTPEAGEAALRASSTTGRTSVRWPQGGASAPGGAAGPAARQSFSFNEAFVNDNANEVDSADVLDGSLTGADVSTSSGDVSHTGGMLTLDNSGPEPALEVTGSGFFLEDDGPLAGGTGIRVFHDSFTGAGQIFSYDYTMGESKDLLLQVPGGKVGIGTATPATTLDIDGAVTIRGGADIVERFDIAEGTVEPGTVVVIDPRQPGDLLVSSDAYDRKVAGIVSGAGGVKPGICLGQEGVMDGATPVAMTGRVYVRATAENGAIVPGDRLTTAHLAGHAMKATDADRSVGAVIGKAMTSLDEGTGLVLVLVNLQ